MEDSDVQRDMKHWPFKVKGKDGKPVITVKYKGEDKDLVRFSVVFMKDWHVYPLI